MNTFFSFSSSFKLVGRLFFCGVFVLFFTLLKQWIDLLLRKVMEPIRSVEGDKLGGCMMVILRVLVVILHSYVLLPSPGHILDFE